MKPEYCGTFIVINISTRKKNVNGKKCVNLIIIKKKDCGINGLHFVVIRVRFLFSA